MQKKAHLGKNFLSIVYGPYLIIKGKILNKDYSRETRKEVIDFTVVEINEELYLIINKKYLSNLASKKESEFLLPIESYMNYTVFLVKNSGFMRFVNGDLTMLELVNKEQVEKFIVDREEMPRFLRPASGNRTWLDDLFFWHTLTIGSMSNLCQDDESDSVLFEETVFSMLYSKFNEIDWCSRIEDYNGVVYLNVDKKNISLDDFKTTEISNKLNFYEIQNRF